MNVVPLCNIITDTQEKKQNHVHWLCCTLKWKLISEGGPNLQHRHWHSKTCKTKLHSLAARFNSRRLLPMPKVCLPNVCPTEVRHKDVVITIPSTKEQEEKQQVQHSFLNTISFILVPMHRFRTTQRRLPFWPFCFEITAEWALKNMLEISTVAYPTAADYKQIFLCSFYQISNNCLSWLYRRNLRYIEYFFSEKMTRPLLFLFMRFILNCFPC